ncbi:MAG: hypothetical protein JW957_07335 [Candidatus Omnitrophica bacterium]|nr:hypothetical protein [Candidatus Omnitrophota bacterium]
MPYEQIDKSQIRVLPLGERKSFIRFKDVAVSSGDAVVADEKTKGKIELLAQRILGARARGASVMLVYGAHLIKNGAGPLLNEIMEKGFVTHLATHGAGIIHDWEFAYQGETSESVRDNAPVGRFGTWDETGRSINLAALAGAAEGIGLGEAVGRFIAEDGLTLPSPDFLHGQIRMLPEHTLTAARADLLKAMIDFDLPEGKMEVKHAYKEYSVAAAAYGCGVPFTVHPGIGYDIYANHPMFHGGAIGRCAGTDAGIFAAGVMNLSGGVYMSAGSAVMSPQIFEKAFSAANNIREQRHQPFISGHYIFVNDIASDGDWDWSKGEPPKEHPAYYLRFFKSFYRMGGTAVYLRADNRIFLKLLVSLLKKS